MEKCKFCRKDFKKNEIENHELYCVSNYNISENLIPCELCSNLIEFDKYNDHISNCSPITNVFNNPNFIIYNLDGVTWIKNLEECKIHVKQWLEEYKI